MPVLLRRPAPAGVLAASLLLVGVLGACATPDTPGDTAVPVSGAPSPSAAPAPDPAVAAYCATVLRVQQEQTAPGAAQGGTGLTTAADTARRQVRDLAATAPPEIAGDWATLATLTDQALSSLTATGGDPNRIDRGALTRLQAQSQPAVERIKQVTAQRCGITFRPPA